MGRPRFRELDPIAIIYTDLETALDAHRRKGCSEELVRGALQRAFEGSIAIEQVAAAWGAPGGDRSSY